MENKNGFILNSKFKSAGNVVISRGKERFDRRDLRTSCEIPGPGQYKVNDRLKV